MPRKRAIVTGASSGIGAATAVALAERGYDLGFTYREYREGAIRTRDAVVAKGRNVVFKQVDQGDPDAAAAAVGALASDLGGIDALVNNAAVNPRRSMQTETTEHFLATLAVNLVGPAMIAQVAADLMMESKEGGRIVNVSSVLAREAMAGSVAYCVSKAGLEQFTRVMALEWAGHGIRVNCVRPGHTATKMTGFSDNDPTDLELIRPVVPLERAARAEEVASVIAGVLEFPSYVTGATIVVDGGLSLHSGSQALKDAM